MTDKQPLEGRVAVVTGAGRGLGRAYAKALAASGARVAVNNRSAETAASAVEEIKRTGGYAVECAADLESEGAAQEVIDRTVEAFGRIDIVINNAGGAEAPQTPFAATPPDARDAVMRQNLATTWGVSQAAWPHLVASGSGRILLTSSPLALYGGAGLSHYAAAKGAVLGLARTMAVEGAEHGITVNVLNPLAATAEMPDDDSSRWYTATFQVEHVAAAVVWLVDERCTVTGEIFSLGGRRVARVAISESAGFVAAAPLTSAESLAADFDAVFSEGGSSRQMTTFDEFMDFVGQLHK